MRICLFALIICLLPGCVDYTADLCIPHVDTFCYQDQTYWLDSCDRLENVLEDCECGCRADQYGCRTCGEKECETDADCPEGFFCDESDWLCKKKGCVPECEGKCCGPDGCGGNCPSRCPGAQECNMVTCACEAHCTSNADCAPNQCCYHGQCTVMTCGTLECGPDPTCGYECGPCPRGLDCDDGECVQTQTCRRDSDCIAGQCCRNRQCQNPDCQWLECGPDPVCGFECGPCPAGYNCVNGGCQGGGQLCPLGQECVDITGGSYMGCVIPPNTIPPDNQTNCAQTNCEGNYSCQCMDQNCSQSICIENCGSCPADTECCELWAGGLWGCLTIGCTDLPPNPPYCDAQIPCQGNAICYTDGTNNFCIDNCSAYGDNCTEGAMRCLGNFIQICQNGAWIDAIDCASNGQVCVNNNCAEPAQLGEFCENIPCAAGLDCLGTPDSQHSFCSSPCTCGDAAGCQNGWSCIFSAGTQCWCGVECNTAADCPNGGADWECIYMGQDEQGQNIYGCLPQ